MILLPNSIPDESLNWDVELRNLSDFMEGFSAEEKELVFLRYYDELRLAEIAEIFKAPVGYDKIPFEHAVNPP